jgi:hypothetical protein
MIGEILLLWLKQQKTNPVSGKPASLRVGGNPLANCCPPVG